MVCNILQCCLMVCNMQYVTALFDGMRLPKFVSVRDKYHLQYLYELLSLKHTSLPPAISSVLYFCYTKLIQLFAKQ